MFGKRELRQGRADDIARLASNTDQAPTVISAVARKELQSLTADIESFLANTSTLSASASRVETLISTAEERGQGGFVQWVKVLFGAPTREQCLTEALSTLDTVRLRIDSLAMLAIDVQKGIEDTQTWIDALQDAIPSLPEGSPRDAARSRVMDLKAMVANGENTFSPYANLAKKSEALQAWSLRAQNSLEA